MTRRIGRWPGGRPTFPEQARARVVSALAGPTDGLGERLTRTYLELWEDPPPAARW